MVINGRFLVGAEVIGEQRVNPSPRKPPESKDNNNYSCSQVAS